MEPTGEESDFGAYCEFTDSVFNGCKHQQHSCAEWHCKHCLNQQINVISEYRNLLHPGTFLFEIGLSIITAVRWRMK